MEVAVCSRRIPGVFQSRIMGTTLASYCSRHRGKAVGLVLLLLAALVLASRHSVSVKDGYVGQLSWLAARPLPAQRRGGSRLPHVYLLANSPAANATWREMQVGKDDILVMFNQALPLPSFAAVPVEQKVIVLRGLNSTYIHAEDQITRFSRLFDQIVFIETNFTSFLALGSGREHMPVVGHYVVLERRSRFMQEQVYATYPAFDRATGKRKIWPSTGFIAAKYFQQYLPLHALVLVGFSGEGLPAHDFEFEQEFYSRLCVERL